MKYQTKGTCSTSIDVEVEDGIIKFVQFYGGCNQFERTHSSSEAIP